MTNHQINQLKVIVSQFQVDTNAENKIEDENNVLPEEDSNNAFYKTMEPTWTGNCETHYDISPLPDYLTRDTVSELNGEEQFMQIVKTRNNNNCYERSGYFYNITGHYRRLDDQFPLSEISRIIISGSLKNYTIQSSITTNKVNGSPDLHDLYDYVNITLESVEQKTNDLPLRFGNMVDIGSLVYIADSQNRPRPEARQFQYARQYATPMNAKSEQCKYLNNFFLCYNCSFLNFCYLCCAYMRNSKFHFISY